MCSQHSWWEGPPYSVVLGGLGCEGPVESPIGHVEGPGSGTWAGESTTRDSFEKGKGCPF